MAKITPKQAKIIKSKVEGYTQNDIAKVVYPNATPESGAVLVSRELRKVNVQEALQEAMEKLNLTPERALKPIDDALDAEDLEMRLKGSDRALRLMMPRGDGVTINQQFNVVAQEQRDKYGI